MNCDEIRDLLESYIGADVADETRSEIEEHLLTCPSCAAEYETLKGFVGELRTLGTAYRPALFLEGRGAATFARAPRRRWRSSLAAVAAALLAAAAVAVAVSVTSAPQTADTHPALNSQRQKVVARARNLHAEKPLRQTSHPVEAARGAEVHTSDEVRISSETTLRSPAGVEQLAVRTGVGTFIQRYFSARVEAEIKGSDALAIKKQMAPFFGGRVAAAEQESYVMLGSQADVDAAGTPPSDAGSFAVIKSIAVSRNGRRVTVTVKPVAYRIENGTLVQSFSGDDGGTYTHVVTLQKRDGHWKVIAHVHLSAAGIELARRGGAPEWVLDGMRTGIREHFDGLPRVSRFARHLLEQVDVSLDDGRHQGL